MSRRVLRRPAFVDDLTLAYQYLAQRNPGAADRLLDEVEVTIELLALFPAMGRRRDELRVGVRSIRLRRFPYIVFYRHDADSITMLRVVHGARELRRIRLT